MENKYTVKLLREDDEVAVYGGYGVVFGGKDLEGDTFTKDTDFMLGLVPKPPAFIDHAMGTSLELEGKNYKLTAIDDPVGEVISIAPDEVGLYMEIQVQKANRYWQIVDAMQKTKRLGLSSGAVPHLVKRDGGIIKRWALFEESFTLTPAEPRTARVERLKQFINEHQDLEAILLKAVDPATDNAMEQGDNQQQPIKNEVIIMSEETEKDNAANTRMDALENQVKDIGTSISALVKALSENPKARGVTIAPDSEGTQHANVKSLGDFLLCLANGNTSRLKSVYSSTKDQTEGTGTAGGFLVPEEFVPNLLQVTQAQNRITSMITRQPVSRPTGSIPALDQFITPAVGTGETALAAGITTSATAEAAALTEKNAQFEMVTWLVNKIGGYTQASKELREDSAIAIEGLLTNLFGLAIASKNEYYVLHGSGAGEPLGIVNSSASVAVVDSGPSGPFAIADVSAMMESFMQVTTTQPFWIMHQTMINKLVALESSAGGGIWQANYTSPMPMSLMGYPIIFSQHMALDGDVPNRVILADLGAYVWFERRGLSIEFSGEVGFLNDLDTWKFTQRADGKPWMRAPITQSNPGTAHTVSPFVRLIEA